MSLFSSLITAYQQLPEERRLKFGYANQKISYCIILKDRGNDFDVMDLRQTQAKSTHSYPKVLPLPSSPSRTGKKLAPHFLWDNMVYLFGVDFNDKNKCFELVKTDFGKRKHDEFKTKHLNFLSECEHIEIKAFCKFIRSWLPNKNQFQKLTNKIKSTEMVNCIFAHEDTYHDRFLHQNHEIEKLWSIKMNGWHDKTTKLGQSVCFLTGEHGPIEPTHPCIKGVWGTQSSGAPLISFNLPPFKSYGRDQGDNVPISSHSAFSYSTALNAFLNDDIHKIRIGETTVVFWSSCSNAKTSEEAVSIFSEFLNPRTEEEISDIKIKDKLQAIKRGDSLSNLELDDNIEFFVLGLSPNKSRIFVRFFWEGTFGHLIDNFRKYIAEIKVSESENNYSIMKIVTSLAVQNKRENIIPRLAGEFLDSILSGKPYPLSLLTNSLIRIRADGNISTPRVGVMKAILIRNLKREVPMTLNKDFSDRGYVLGRLFAAYEKIQGDALGNVNSSVKDKYFGLASASPQQAFSTLMDGSQKHLSKIRKSKPGQAVNLEKLVGSIMELMAPDKDPIPISLNLSEQAMFGIGYYHQRNDFFRKKESSIQTNEVLK